jgi:hypothetical protein
VRQRLAVGLVAALAMGCGEPTAEPVTAAVTIVYAAATGMPPQYPGCLVNQTQIAASWLDYQGYFMTPDPPDRWTITYPDVPTGVEQRIRVNDPRRCDASVTGVATDGITANGVTLTRLVDTPGQLGDEPGLAFTVAPGGAVSAAAAARYARTKKR